MKPYLEDKRDLFNDSEKFEVKNSHVVDIFSILPFHHL